MRCDNLLVSSRFRDDQINVVRRSDFRDPGTDVDLEACLSAYRCLSTALDVGQALMLQMLSKISHQLLGLSGARVGEYCQYLVPAVTGREASD